jgi:hypothetical protein
MQAIQNIGFDQLLRAQKKGGKCMETFAVDGGVQPHSQPQPDSGNSADCKSKVGDQFPQLQPPISALRNEGLLRALIPTGRNGLGGQRAVCSPGALRLHPAFNDLNLAGWLISSESEGKPCNVNEPILSTKRGILLAGFADWHAAVLAGEAAIDCTDFIIDDDAALRLILSLHRQRSAWNDFTRTELALQQGPYFQAKALANLSSGGKHKGLANLPEAEHIVVRDKIGDLAGVSPRTVSNVKIILKKAHPSLIAALHNGVITTNRALALCHGERCKQQVEELANFMLARSNNKTNSAYIDKLQVDKLSANLPVLLAKLKQFETTNPSSVEVRPGAGKNTVIVLGKAHLNTLAAENQAGLA